MWFLAHMRFLFDNRVGMICFHSIYNHTHEFIKRVCGSPQIPEAPTTTNDRRRKQDPYVVRFMYWYIVHVPILCMHS